MQLENKSTHMPIGESFAGATYCPAVATAVCLHHWCLLDLVNFDGGEQQANVEVEEIDNIGQQQYCEQQP